MVFSAAMSDYVLEIEDLRTYFYRDGREARAVDGVTYRLPRGSTLGLVGESGCGKSVTALSILRLVPDPPGRIVGGSIRFEGRELLGLSEQEMRKHRGRDIAMIFQEPHTSLNPVMRVGEQIIETIRVHQPATSRSQARARALELLQLVGIPSPEERSRAYPHQLSGGMKQRVMIAMALSLNPRLLIADEPTTALDVTIQAQILDLLRHLQREFHMSILLITHDLGVVAEMADEVVVMYAGQVVEAGPVGRLLTNPSHPYTEGLLQSLPKLGHRVERLTAIPGVVPSPFALPTGCRFRNRCGYAFSECERVPPRVEIEAGHQSACWLPEIRPEHPFVVRHRSR